MEKTEINTDQLQQLLEKYSQELQVSFLERRGKSQMHKDSALDELRDVIKELSNREKELKALVGISKMLLDNSEILNAQLEATKEKKHSKSLLAKRLKQDLDETKEKLITAESRFEETNRFLLNAEREILEINCENRKLKRRANTWSPCSEELQQVKRSCDTQLKTLRKSLFTSQNTEKLLKEKLIELEDNNNKLSLTNNKLTRELEHHRGTIRELENEMVSILGKSEDRELVLQKTNVKYAKALKKIRKLEEELQILDTRSADQHRPQISSRSLLTELVELGEDTRSIIEHKIPCKFTMCFQTESVGSVDLSKKPCENSKDSCEEFFILAALSVKMNSPYMDTICTIPTQTLYRKAISLEVPFHKWFDWIKDELNTIYIQMIYKKNSGIELNCKSVNN